MHLILICGTYTRGYINYCVNPLTYTPAAASGTLRLGLALLARERRLTAALLLIYIYRIYTPTLLYI